MLRGFKNRWRSSLDEMTPVGNIIAALICALIVLAFWAGVKIGMGAARAAIDAQVL